MKLRNWAIEEHHPRKPPKPRSERDAKLLAKTKLCWFHEHHPQGCPHSTSSCPYAHGLHELRERPDFSTVDPAILNASLECGAETVGFFPNPKSAFYNL